MRTPTLLRWGGFAAIVTGFLAPLGMALRLNGQALPGQYLVFIAVVLSVFAFTAIYAAQADRAGRLGFAGFTLTVLGKLLTVPIAFAWLATFGGLQEAHALVMFAWGSVPIMHLAILGADLGAALLGVATMRAGVLPRWAGLMLAIGAVLDLVAEYTSPLLLGIYPAIVLLAGSSLVWMGWAIVAANAAGRPAARLSRVGVTA